MTQHEIKNILEIGVMLSSERDLEKLLARVLDCVMDLARCDAGTLYLLEGDHLAFKLMRNSSGRCPRCRWTGSTCAPCPSWTVGPSPSTMCT